MYKKLTSFKISGIITLNYWKGLLSVITLLSILQQFVTFFIAIIATIVNLIPLQSNTVSVELYANPDSGYQWEYEYDKTQILTLSSTYYTHDTSSILSNSGGGIQHFNFRPVGEGTVNITFSYVKYSGNRKIVASRYVYTYTVSGSKATLCQVR